jgi:hypothetical protein
MALKEGLTAALEVVIGTGKVHPLRADEDEKPPYAVYLQASRNEYQSLNGYEGLTKNEYEISVFHKSHSALCTIADSAVTALKALLGTMCGGVFIQDIVVDENSPELYEPEVKLYRKIINLKIMY